MIYTACGEFVEQYSHSLDPLPTQTGSLDDVHFNYLKYTLDFAQQNTYQELREGEFYSPDNTLIWKLYDLKRANEDTDFIFAKDLKYATFGTLSSAYQPFGTDDYNYPFGTLLSFDQYNSVLYRTAIFKNYHDPYLYYSNIVAGGPGSNLPYIVNATENFITNKKRKEVLSVESGIIAGRNPLKTECFAMGFGQFINYLNGGFLQGAIKNSIASSQDLPEESERKNLDKGFEIYYVTGSSSETYYTNWS